MRTTQDCSASNALVSSAAVQPPCAAAPATRVALGAHDRAALEGAARKASRRAWLSACALLGIAVSPLGASAVSHAAGPGFSGQEPIVEAQSGPYLEWRNLAGEVRPMGLTQTPKGELENLFGHWMRPMGLAAMPLLDEASETVAKIGLIGGDHVIAQVAGGDAGALDLAGPKNVPLAISIDLLDSIVFPARRRGMGALERPAQGDRLYRQTGSTMDRVDGVLLGFSEQGVRLETSLGERVFPWGEVVALFIEPLDDLDSEGATAEETAVVHLTCGSRLRGKLLAINANDIVLESGFGPWAIPYAWIHELTRLDGTFRFLSWLTPEPSAGPRSPFDPPGSEPLGMVWPAQVDRAVGGGLLRAGGRVWSHGLGVHAPSRMLWKLDGSDCSLRLSASLDDSARRGDQFGSVVFQVLVDGKEAWRSGLRQGDQAPVTPDPISLQGAQTLELIVTDGGDGPVLDRAAWLAPILVACPGSAGDRR